MGSRFSATRLYVISLGYIENDLAWNLAGVHAASRSRRQPGAEWVRVPCLAYLIEHPTAGRVLFDTGIHPDDPQRLPEYTREYFPWVGGPEDLLAARLEAMQLKPSDIDRVIVSHMHWDHGGGLYLFSGLPAGQRVLVGRQDLQHGLLATHVDARQPFGGGGYFRPHFEVPGIAFDPVGLEAGDIQLAPGLRLIQLWGHTPQLLGLVVELEHSGTVILPSDALYMARNFGPPPVLPTILHDSVGFLRAVEKVRWIQHETGGWILYPHDPEQRRTLRIAPEFYD